jgi:hypothetical protein
VELAEASVVPPAPVLPASVLASLVAGLPVVGISPLLAALEDPVLAAVALPLSIVLSPSVALSPM